MSRLKILKQHLVLSLNDLKPMSDTAVVHEELLNQSIAHKARNTRMIASDFGEFVEVEPANVQGTIFSVCGQDGGGL